MPELTDDEVLEQARARGRVLVHEDTHGGTWSWAKTVGDDGRRPCWPEQWQAISYMRGMLVRWDG